MAGSEHSLLRRALVKSDCAFWCIHDHPDVLALLGLPTLVALIAAAFGLGAAGSWMREQPVALFVLSGVVAPFLALCIFTVLPLPCAVFAWKAAMGEVASARECIAYCGSRGGRLFGVFFRLGLLWLGSLLLLGIPLLWVVPRTSLVPLVALFENVPKTFHRSRKILREDFGVLLMLGSLYLLMGLVLGGLVVLPRLLVGTPMLGAHLLDARWRPAIVQHLWIFESLSVAVLLTAIAMSWWISLTLVYHDIRWNREGENLKGQIARLREKLVA